MSLRTQCQESSAKNSLSFRWCHGLGYAGNQLQQNSSGTSQKPMTGAMISRHQAGVEYQKRRGVWELSFYVYVYIREQDLYIS